MLKEKRLSQPAVYAVVYAAFAIGLIVAWLHRGIYFEAMLSRGWCISMIAWFPFAVVFTFRRYGMPNYVFAAAMISLIAGFDAIIRLFPYFGC